MPCGTHNWVGVAILQGWGIIQRRFSIGRLVHCKRQTQQSMFRSAWQRMRILGESNGEYIAVVVTTLMFYFLLIPFALIARLINPLDVFSFNKPNWRARKPVGTTIKEARRQS
jgi:hypothetical protein